MRMLLVVFLLLSQVIYANEIKREDWVIDHFRWAKPLESLVSMQVENFYGDIRTRTAQPKEAMVSAVIQHHILDPIKPNIKITHHQGAWVIRVEYLDTQHSQSLPIHINKRRVDLTLLVPDHIPIHARSRNGLIEVKGHKNRLEALSSKGNIVVSSAGYTHAHTQHGKIKAFLTDGGWSQTPVLETLTGNIQLQLLGDANVSLEITTSGRITTDYSLQIKRRANSERKTIYALIGKGTHKIVINSDMGYVDLTRFSIFR